MPLSTIFRDALFAMATQSQRDELSQYLGRTTETWESVVTAHGYYACKVLERSIRDLELYDVLRLDGLSLVIAQVLAQEAP